MDFGVQDNDEDGGYRMSPPNYLFGIALPSKFFRLLHKVINFIAIKKVFW